MVSIAQKNLFHDKGRFAITIIGIAASLMLIFFGLGMTIGTVDSMVSIIDHSEADIWVLSEGTMDLIQEQSIIQENVLSDIERTEGIKSLHRLIYYANMVEKDSIRQPVTIVGIDVSSTVVAPWNLISGSIDNLRRDNTIIVDQSIERELGKISIGDHVSIGNISQEIVGISKDAKSFIYPLIFTSHTNAQKLCHFKANETNYVLIEVQPTCDTAEVAKEISRIDGVNALLKSDIRKNTIDYMLYKSGMGVGTVTFAVVGLFVAVVVISLAIYTATMERIPEFGTLKAIGASKKNIHRILIEQVFWSATIGYVLGLILSILAIRALTSVILMPIKVTAMLAIITYLLTLLLSILGSFLSIRKVNKIDPAIVFRA